MVYNPISFASAPGNLMNCIGKCGLLVSNVDTIQDTLLQSMTNTTTGVVAQFNNESDIQATVGNSYIGTLSSVEGPSTLGQTVAIQEVNRAVFRSNPQLNQTLTQGNTLSSLQEIIRQMEIAGASVLAMAITSVPQVVTGQPGPNFTGVGNGVILTSVKRPLDGLVLENSFAET